MSDTWYYADRSGRVGPFSLADLKARLAGLPNAADVFVWRAGFQDWKRVGEVAELGGGGGGLPSFAQFDAASAASPDFVSLWFGFKGRINRAKFWLVALVNTVILMIGAGLAYATGSTVVWVLFGLF